MKLAMIQLHVTHDAQDNMTRGIQRIKEAYLNDAKIVVLPEMFVCPYSNASFLKHAQSIDGERVQVFKKLSEDIPVLIVAGSMPILSGDVITNTSLVFYKGHIIARHDKLHLFDIDVPDGIRFFESETLTAGNRITTFDWKNHKIGLCICYDIRFPNLFQAMASKGAELVIIPAAFNMTTGPAHWELLIRSRAIDHQFFVTAVSPARDEKAEYVAFGHSMTVNPWGTIIEDVGVAESVKYVILDFNQVSTVRRNMPIGLHQRKDIYEQ